MADQKRVVFIGGLDDGRMAVELLDQHKAVNLVGAYVLKDDYEDKVSGFRFFDDLVAEEKLFKIRQIKYYADKIAALEPDLILVVGFSQIIPKTILDIPPLGVIGFHSAVLPGRRGNSPIIWAMIDGLQESGVTMFYMDEDIDSGDIIDLERFSIETDEYADSVLHKADLATLRLLERNLDSILDGSVEPIKHDMRDSIYTRKRTPADGEIDWSRPAEEIARLIRALAPPYPMAHTFGGDGIPILIERARVAEHLPVPPPQYVVPNSFQKTVLCISAHPDDEVLGVGGTLSRHAQAGGKVISLILSDGEAAKMDTPKSEERLEQAHRAAEILGIDEVRTEKVPDQGFDSVPFVDILKLIEKAIKKYRPQIVYSHHPGDANTDHQITFKAVYAATRPMSILGGSVERLLTFETPSSTDQAPTTVDYAFTPNVFISIDVVWELKKKALNCYTADMIGGVHPRSVEYVKALARMRGGYAGCELAEGFKLIRERFVH